VKPADDSVVLNSDEHTSRTKNIVLLERAHETQILILSILPHTSRRLQSLNASFA